MKKILISFIATILLMLIPVTVYAADVFSTACKDIQSSSVCQDVTKSAGKNPLFGPEGVLTTTISLLSLVVGIISVLIIIVAGIRFTTSQGDAHTVNSARNQIIYSIVGIIIAALAQVIVLFVLKKL